MRLTLLPLEPRDCPSAYDLGGGVPLAPAAPTAAGAFGVGYGTLAAMADPRTGLNRFGRAEPRGLF